jgi:hypothetical protein
VTVTGTNVKRGHDKKDARKFGRTLMETATCGERNHYLWRCIGPAQGKETTMTFEPRSLEVFQDCALFDSPGGPPFIRDALLTNVVPPWRHNREREEEASKHTIGDADIMVFERAAADELPSACLFLFSTPNGYEVSNIVPTNPGQLGYSKYNALLQNFVTLVVNPATERANFKVRLTAPHQSINDWVSSRTATALRQFSAAANKSTGSSHPLDRKNVGLALLFPLIRRRSGWTQRTCSLVARGGWLGRRLSARPGNPIRIRA